MSNRKSITLWRRQFFCKLSLKPRNDNVTLLAHDGHTVVTALELEKSGPHPTSNCHFSAFPLAPLNVSHKFKFISTLRNFQSTQCALRSRHRRLPQSTEFSCFSTKPALLPLPLNPLHAHDILHDLLAFYWLCEVFRNSKLKVSKISVARSPPQISCIFKHLSGCA